MTNEKRDGIVAYQVAPDYAEADFEYAYGELIENEHLVIDGNRDYKSFTCVPYDAAKAFYNGEIEADELASAAGMTRELTDEEIQALNKVFELRYEEDALVKVLSIITKREWECRVIRGCVQADWNIIYYDTKIDKRDVEGRYFNTGSEWHIECEGDDFDVWHYTTAWDEETIRKEIADVVGCDVEDVRMFAFDGYTHMPKYKEI